jgi:hypothetical protein
MNSCQDSTDEGSRPVKYMHTGQHKYKINVKSLQRVVFEQTTPSTGVSEENLCVRPAATVNDILRGYPTKILHAFFLSFFLRPSRYVQGIVITLGIIL